MPHPKMKRLKKSEEIKTATGKIDGAENKISEEELTQLRQLNADVVNTTREIGVMAVKKMDIEEALYNLRDKQIQTEEDMRTLLEDLGKKYNMESIDLVDGSFKKKEAEEVVEKVEE